MFSRWMGPLLVTGLFFALMACTWRKWPDVLVDFGYELYVPWVLTMGKVLYVDVDYFNGPFSACLNALWFRLFGVSLTTLALSNLAILAVLTGLIYRIFSSACDGLTATCACGVFLSMFAFSQYTIFGSENFVCPYSHDATHGTALAVASLYFLSRYMKDRTPAACAAAGFLFGLVFLTKAEIFAATVLAAAVGMVLAGFTEAPGRGARTWWAVRLFGGMAILPIVVFFILLWLRMPAKTAARGIAGTWTAILGSDAPFGTFQRNMLGLDQPGLNAGITIGTFAAIAVLVGLLAAMDIGSRNVVRGRPAVLVFAGVMITLLFMSSPQLIPTEILGRPLPLIALAATLSLAALSYKYRSNEELFGKLGPMALWAAFSFGMLGKMILNAKISHYGFFLAMPATLTLVACGTHLIPRALQSTIGRGDLVRVVALTSILMCMAAHVRESLVWHRLKTWPVGSNGDLFYTYGPQVEPRGAATSEVLRQIESSFPPAATFAALPEGVMLNYLSRRMNSTPHVVLMPTTVDILGNENILNQFSIAPPDFVILVHKDAGEWGRTYFGTDERYGRALMEWVKSHYDRERRVLSEPLKDDRFGMEIFRRRHGMTS